MFSEQALVSVRAAVYYFEGAEWKPADGGLSYVQLYHNPLKDTFRVVAISQMIKDKVPRHSLLSQLIVEPINLLHQIPSLLAIFFKKKFHIVAEFCRCCSHKKN